MMMNLLKQRANGEKLTPLVASMGKDSEIEQILG